MLDDSRIPVIDLSAALVGDTAARTAVSRRIDEACRDVGFLLVVGHGVSSELVEGMRATTSEFFSRPEDDKRRATIPTDPSRGFAGMGDTNLSASYGLDAPPDLKETFTVGPIAEHDEAYRLGGGPFFRDNVWPAEPRSFEATWRSYYASMETLATELMRLFALALGVDEGFFDDKVDRHITYLTAQHYPGLDGPPRPGQLRAGAHTDFGSLTILQRDTAPGGLQVQVDGRWVDAPHVPGSFTINIGDLMSDWTDGRWVSTLHRVVPPPADVTGSTERLSLTFFHQPNYEAVIEPLETCRRDGTHREPVTSGEHFLRKLTAVRGG
jgi:isopenicillin N synthase-like dioxygenase